MLAAHLVGARVAAIVTPGLARTLAAKARHFRSLPFCRRSELLRLAHHRADGLQEGEKDRLCRCAPPCCTELVADRRAWAGHLAKGDIATQTRQSAGHQAHAEVARDQPKNGFELDRVLRHLRHPWLRTEIAEYKMRS
jgi:hypothetical protein